MGKAKKYNFNHREMHSRNEIALEQYILAIDVEDAPTLEMANTMILPAAPRYQTELANNISSLKAVGIDADTATLDEVSGKVAELRSGIVALRSEIDHDDVESPEKHAEHAEHAEHAQKGLLPAMDTVRSASYALEALMADDQWPLAAGRLSGDALHSLIVRTSLMWGHNPGR
jgi:glutamine synthetase